MSDSNLPEKRSKLPGQERWCFQSKKCNDDSKTILYRNRSEMMDRRQLLKSIPALLLSFSLPLPLRRKLKETSDSAQSIGDVHVHLIASSPENGCFVSPRYQQSFFYNFVRSEIDINQSNSAIQHDQQYVDKLISLFETSPQHRFGILLAMDGIYDSSGNLDRENTPFYVSNDYLFRVCRKSEKFIPGVSVNPFRRDALDELDRIAELGAVLVKWIPGSQNINPSDKRIIPFYHRLRELRLPLLTHCGVEFAVPVIKQSYGNPALLKPALEEGVDVIVAHCAVDGFDRRGSYFHRFLDLLDLYPNLSGDISSLTMAHKSYRLRYLLDHPDLFNRLYYGSDFPLQFFPATSPFYFLGRISMREAWIIQEISNVLIRDIETLKALKIPGHCLERGIDLEKKRKLF